MARETLLARALVELADNLVSDFDVAELLVVLTDHCVDVLDVSAAGIMLASPAGDLRVMASSSEEMRLLELYELQSREGPCLDCYTTGRPVVNVDLAGDDPRWPQFAERATAAGFGSVHALPLRLRGSVLGALNMFHVHAGQMRPGDIAAAQALADVATIAIIQHRAAAEAKLLNEQLSEALNTRIVIEQAKGMIAQRHGVDMETAFNAVRDHARTHNLRLADVARDITEGRYYPAAPDQP
jgi:GAF domain-containing protein